MFHIVQLLRERPVSNHRRTFGTEQLALPGPGGLGQGSCENMILGVLSGNTHLLVPKCRGVSVTFTQERPTDTHKEA